MIRTNHLAGPPARRIAVIEMPRPQRARMGSIGCAADYPSRNTAISWTTVTTEAPESTGNFMSSVLAKQNLARTTTPGTLTYTPANNTPAQNVAPWNSWLQPNCPPGGMNPPATATADDSVPAPRSPWLILIGVIGGLASAKYLLNGGR
jgi:hypothetical protein